MIKMKDFDFGLTAIPADSDWGRCITSYLNQIYRKCESPHSQDHFRSGLEAFFSIHPRKLPDEYTTAEVEAWINSPCTSNGRIGQPVKTPTVNNRLSMLTSFYRYSTSYGVQGNDGRVYPLLKYLSPTAGVRFAKYPHYASTKALTDDELRSFFAAIVVNDLPYEQVWPSNVSNCPRS